MDEHPQPDLNSRLPLGPEGVPGRPLALADAPAAEELSLPPGFKDPDEYFAWVVKLIVGDPGRPEDRPDFVEWLDAEAEEAPPEAEDFGLGVTISLADATDVDPALVTALCGPKGLGGMLAAPLFAHEAAGDGLRPSPVLAALTEQALAGGLERMTEVS